MARLEKFYTDEVAPALMKKFGYKSVMQIPKLEKIVVNVGCGEARDNQKIVEAIMGDLACPRSWCKCAGRVWKLCADQR